MRCEEARECISRDLDRELPVERSAELEQHLKDCTECARITEDFRRLQSAMLASPAPAPESGYWDTLLTRVAQSAASQAKREHSRWRLFRSLSFAAAAASVLLAVGIVAQQSRIKGLQSQVAQLRSAQALIPAAEFAKLSAQCSMPAVSTASLREQQAVFGDLSQYYQGNLKWLVEDGSQTDVGVSDETSTSNAPQEGEPMIAQFQLVRLDADGTSEVISAPTLLMLPGSEARFNLEASRGNTSVRLPYRCALLKQDGGATLSVSLDLDPSLDGQSAKLSGVAQLRAGSCQPVAFTRAGDVSYALFVALLPRPASVPEKAGT